MLLCITLSAFSASPGFTAFADGYTLNPLLKSNYKNQPIAAAQNP
jgi:hypothetical protein